MIFNIHSHLNDKSKEEQDMLIEECLSLGVDKICAIGYDYKSSMSAYELANRHKNVYCFCGLQPEEIYDYDGDFKEYLSFYDNPKCLGIGEIGLDYHYTKENKLQQMKLFEKQIKIAIQYHKPIEIHSRDADLDTYNIIEKYAPLLDGFILHCFSGSSEMAKRYVKLGGYISISGVVTFKNAKEIKEVVKEIDINRLLVETDDPYLTPVPYRGQENHPSYVYYVVKEIASIKGMDFDEVSKILYDNALRVFHL